MKHSRNVIGESSIMLTFSEPILEASMNAENFSLMDAESQAVSGNFQNNGSSVFFLPSLPLEHFR